MRDDTGREVLTSVEGSPDRRAGAKVVDGQGLGNFARLLRGGERSTASSSCGKASLLAFERIQQGQEAAGHVDVLLELAQDRGELASVNVIGFRVVFDLLGGERTVPADARTRPRRVQLTPRTGRRRLCRRRPCSSAELVL
jgi:hypothetical protein